MMVYVRDLSDIWTQIFDFPNQSINEDVPKKERYGFQEAKMIIRRLVPILLFLNMFKTVVNTI